MKTISDYKKAIADYTKAIALDPKNAEAYFNRGNVKWKLQDYKGAIADYTKAIKFDPEDVDAYNNRGVAKADLNDHKGAIAGTHKFILTFKWYKNDNGGDRRTICIDYKNEADKHQQKTKILKDFRTLPMDIGVNKGRIPYSVTTNNPDWR